MGSQKKIPLRKCVGCQEMKPKKELIRIVMTPEGDLLVDRTGKVNGRGAYVCPNSACLEKAIKNSGLSRSFKMKTDPSVLRALLDDEEKKEL